MASIIPYLVRLLKFGLSESSNAAPLPTIFGEVLLWKEGMKGLGFSIEQLDGPLFSFLSVYGLKIFMSPESI